RQQCFEAVDDSDNVRSELPLNIDNDGGFLIYPRSLLRIFDIINDTGDVRQTHRRTLAVGDDELLVISARHELIVCADRINLLLTLEVTFGLVHVRSSKRGSNVFQSEAICRKRSRVDAYPDPGLLSAADAHESHTGQLRNLLIQRRVCEVFDSREQ